MVPQASTRLSLKNILFTTDFSPASAAALPYAVSLARWYGAKVYVAHAAAPEPHLAVPMDPMPLEFDSSWREADRKMKEFLRADPLKGLPHAVVLEQGHLWDVLAEVIRQREIDLLVLGTHGRQGVKKLVLGSAAEQIFRQSACPVLTVGPKVSRPAVQFETLKCILFATDFSSGSLHALPYALSLAEENQASLIFLHLIPLVPLQRQEMVEESGRRRLRALVPSDAELWCKPEFIVRFDFPAEGILQVAEEKNAGLIVMGVHRAASPRASAHMPWATAYEVVCHAPCPVLTVRG